MRGWSMCVARTRTSLCCDCAVNWLGAHAGSIHTHAREDTLTRANTRTSINDAMALPRCFQPNKTNDNHFAGPLMPPVCCAISAVNAPKVMPARSLLWYPTLTRTHEGIDTHSYTNTRIRTDTSCPACTSSAQGRASPTRSKTGMSLTSSGPATGRRWSTINFPRFCRITRGGWRTSA